MVGGGIAGAGMAPATPAGGGFASRLAHSLLTVGAYEGTVGAGTSRSSKLTGGAAGAVP